MTEKPAMPPEPAGPETGSTVGKGAESPTPVRILIDLMSDGAQYEYTPDSLGIDATDGLTAEQVIAALQEVDSKTRTAQDLGLLDEDGWKLFVQVKSGDQWTRAEW